MADVLKQLELDDVAYVELLRKLISVAVRSLSLCMCHALLVVASHA